LFRVPADGVELAVQHRDADMVRAARQRQRVGPTVCRRVVDLMVGPVHALFAVSADKVHSRIHHGRPGHLAARQRQRRTRDPTPLVLRFRCGAVDIALRRGGVWDVDPPGLLQPLVKRSVTFVLGKRRNSRNQAEAAREKASAINGTHGRTFIR
jgi:hypothetical protein